MFSFAAAVTDFPAGAVAAGCGGASIAGTFSVGAASGASLSAAGAVVSGCVTAALEGSGLLCIGDARRVANQIAVASSTMAAPIHTGRGVLLILQSQPRIAEGNFASQAAA